jgi:class 3 adenylate cyclase
VATPLKSGVKRTAQILRSLGLEQYEAAFRENAIDDTVLQRLTAEDLKDLGVNLVGHRLKLLDAIAALRTDAARDAAERRQVTVMFSDLVGSTALAARMDPEDLREVISAYQNCVAETVRRFDGFVARYMGDGVLVYFGYPRAHEDDAERAVQAGLELIAAVTALASPVSLQTRIGIATGLVVIGSLIGSGEAQERGIVGETPNLAARLQEIAAPNTVVIEESTRKLVGHFFELEDLGGKDFKGIPRSVQIWTPLRTKLVESRFEALHPTGLTTLVGREKELELLVRLWSKAVKAKWCCSPGRPVSGNRGLPQPCWKALRKSRIHVCAISARPSTPTVRFIRSSVRWNVRLDCYTTTRPSKNSTSSTVCSRRLRPRSRTPHSLPRCSRFRTMAGIPPPN